MITFLAYAGAALGLLLVWSVIGFFIAAAILVFGEEDAFRSLRPHHVVLLGPLVWLFALSQRRAS